jgi:hypothetical protein
MNVKIPLSETSAGITVEISVLNMEKGMKEYIPVCARLATST